METGLDSSLYTVNSLYLTLLSLHFSFKEDFLFLCKKVACKFTYLDVNMNMSYAKLKNLHDCEAFLSK